jgi:hypothetical protein
MGLYLGVKYFQIIHYYYFCMGIFSFTAAIIFGSPYYIYFLAFYVLHSTISWYVAWFVEKRMKKFVVVNSSNYVVSHLILTVVTSAMTLIMWSYSILIERFLIDSIIYMNYFVFFLGVMWYVMTRFNMISSMFDYFDTITFRRAKRLIISKREELGLKRLITDGRIKSYEPGYEKEIDSALMTLWKERRSNLVNNIYRFETIVCNNLIQRFRNRIMNIKAKPTFSAIDQKMINSYEKFIHDYGKRALEYEKFFQQKRGK